MSTIDSPSIIKMLLENDGCYADDPQCYSIYSYINDWGNKIYAAHYHKQGEDSFIASPHIANATLLWWKAGLTSDGIKELERLKK